MPNTKRNAIAELAEKLEILNNGGAITVGEALDALDMATRIIAELAKVDATYIEDPVHNNICHLAYDALKECRVIAEEGVKDGK